MHELEDIGRTWPKFTRCLPLRQVVELEEMGRQTWLEKLEEAREKATQTGHAAELVSIRRKRRRRLWQCMARLRR